MKYKLQKPELTSVDLTKLNFLSNYMGWKFKFNVEKKSALIETEGHNVAYVQKDDNDRLFIIWNHNESIEYLDSRINLIYNWRNMLKLPGKLDALMNLLVIPKEDRVCLR